LRTVCNNGVGALLMIVLKVWGLEMKNCYRKKEIARIVKETSALLRYVDTSPIGRRRNKWINEGIKELELALEKVFSA